METATAVKPAQVPRPLTPAKEPPRTRQGATPVPIWHRSPWNWFFSLGLGVTILVILTIASIIGSMIDPLSRAQALVFYTWWYKLLLIALAVNMTCATVKTIITKLIPTQALRVHTNKSFYANEQIVTRVPFRGTTEQAGAAFRAQGFKVKTDGAAGAARTGWWGRFGAPVSHLGMVIVLLAGFTSSWVAKEAIVQVPEGHTTTTKRMQVGGEGIVPLGFELTVNDFSTGYHPRTRIPSHYTSDITARNNGQVLYAGPVEVNHSPRINGWRLHQTSYQELESLPRWRVEVAGVGLPSPLTTEISPGQTRDLTGAENLRLAMDNRQNWVLVNGHEQLASGTAAGGGASNERLTLVANRFEPDFVLGADREVTSRSDELNNPALHVTLFSNGSPSGQQWLFARDDMKAMAHAPGGHHEIELLDIRGEAPNYTFVVAVTDCDSCGGGLIGRVALTIGEEAVVREPKEPEEPAEEEEGEWTVAIGDRVTAYATVLTLTRNPAIPTIYFGCILMIIGLGMSFFVPRRSVWFLHDAEKGELHVAARYRHPTESFDRTTSAALARLEKNQAPSSEEKEES